MGKLLCHRDIYPPEIYSECLAPRTKEEVQQYIPAIRKDIQGLYKRSRGTKVPWEEVFAIVLQHIHTHWGPRLPLDEEAEVKRLILAELHSHQLHLHFGAPRKLDFIPEGTIPRKPLKLPIPEETFALMLTRASEEYQKLSQTQPWIAQKRRLEAALSRTLTRFGAHSKHRSSLYRLLAQELGKRGGQVTAGSYHNNIHSSSPQ